MFFRTFENWKILGVVKISLSLNNNKKNTISWLLLGVNVLSIFMIMIWFAKSVNLHKIN